MASTTLIPISEYLSTSYRPDCDYIDANSMSVIWASAITLCCRES
jgi:hypothetical protein